MMSAIEVWWTPLAAKHRAAAAVIAALRSLRYCSVTLGTHQHKNERSFLTNRVRPPRNGTRTIILFWGRCHVRFHHHRQPARKHSAEEIAVDPDDPGPAARRGRRVPGAAGSHLAEPDREATQRAGGCRRTAPTGATA